MKRIILLFLLIVLIGNVYAQQIIVYPDSVYCKGLTGEVSYNISGTFNFNPDNVFTAQLSDSSGSFANPEDIGSDHVYGGNIEITIPSSIIPGKDYLIRITSSDPADTSIPNILTDRIKIGISPDLNVFPSDTFVCAGSIVQLVASGSPDYSWSPPIGLSCNTCSNPLASADSTIFYTVTGSNGVCSTSKEVRVLVGNIAIGGVILAIADTVCSGFSTTLKLFGHSNGAIQWQSSIDKVNFFNIVGANDSTCNTGPLTRSHWYQAINGSGNCSAKSDTLEIYVPPAPVASFTVTTAGELVFFNANYSKNAYLYYWDFGDNSSGTGGNISHTYIGPGNYHVCLIASDGRVSDCQDTVCHDINVAPITFCQAYFALYEDENTYGQWYALNQSVGKGPIQYSWSWGDGSSSATDTASHTYAGRGYYKICLTITDDTTCTSTYCDSSIYVYGKVNVVSSLPNAVATVTKEKNNLIIYPNPCTICQIKSSDDANNFVVTDLLGRITEASFVKSSGGYTLNFIDNRTGMFLLKNINTGEVVKFVRE